VTAELAQLGAPARRVHALGHPLGGTPQVVRVTAAGGDRGDAQPVQEVVEQGV
jgi:hypothetical protein